MSTLAGIWCTITVLDKEYEKAMSEWPEKCDEFRNSDGKLELGIYWEEVNCYIETAVSELREELATIPAPASAWKANVRYENYDYMADDGSIVEFEIEDGKAVNWKQSEVVMVECGPYVDFEQIGGTE